MSEQSVYRKPTFTGVCTHFDSFLPDTCKIAIIYTLINRRFRIWSSWSMFHQQLTLLREIFQKNDYAENFIDICFKLFLNRFHILREKVLPVEKKPLRLVLYLGSISLRTRTKLQKYCVHIGISPLTNKRVQPRKDSAVCHHLLNCNYSPIFEDFSALYHENKKYLLEMNESLLITRDRPSMNRNVCSAPIYLFEWIIVTLFAALYGLLWSVFYSFYVTY